MCWYIELSIKINDKLAIPFGINSTKVSVHQGQALQDCCIISVSVQWIPDINHVVPLILDYTKIFLKISRW
jgi:hypothetical protein